MAEVKHPKTTDQGACTRVSFLQLLLTCLCFAAAEKSRSGKTSRGPSTHAANQRCPAWPASRSPHAPLTGGTVATPRRQGQLCFPRPKNQPPHSTSFPILRRQFTPSQPGSLEHLSAAPASIVSRSPFPSVFRSLQRIGSPPRRDHRVSKVRVAANEDPPDSIAPAIGCYRCKQSGDPAQPRPRRRIAHRKPGRNCARH
jgi:hypothetical protein